MSLTERVSEHLQVAAEGGAKLDRISKKNSRAMSLPANPLTLLDRFAVTDEQVENMKSTRIICQGLFALTHMACLMGPAGSGKTAVATYASGVMSAEGLSVWFFQEDASAGDLPALHEHAKQHGYKLLNSTLAGASPEDMLHVLRQLSQSDDADLSNVVIILDTLKKFTDLMSKGQSRLFFQLMRALTQRGGTVIMLGHTNKHRGPDGKLIFEGVGDVRNDVDELIYIESTDKDPAGVVTLTLKPDKVRCVIRERTFQLNTITRVLKPLDHVVDVQALKAAQEQRKEDAALIEAVDLELKAGGMNHTDLVRRVREATGQSRKRVEDVIERYISDLAGTPGALWSETRGVNNARHVAIMPGSRR